MYMGQLLCLVTESFDPQVRQRLAGVQAELTDALLRLGFIHFASLSVLPPLEDGGASSLALELTVDEGLSPEDAVRRVVDAALRPLGQVYAKDGQALDRGALRGLLVPLAMEARAEGGFVGMRDRSVAQIRAEARLFQTARRELGNIRDEARKHETSPGAAELVHQLIARLAGQPWFESLATPAPRSFWVRERSAAAQAALAVIWSAAPIPLLLCLLAIVGWVAHLASRWLLGPPLTALGLGLGAAGALLLLAAVLVAGILMMRLSPSALIAAAAAAGAGVFDLMLVAGYVKLLGTGGGSGWPYGVTPTSLGAVSAVALVAILGIWRWFESVRRPMWADLAGWGMAVAGVLLSAALLGVCLRGTLDWPGPDPRAWLPFVLPLALGLALLKQSPAARWYFGLNLVLCLLLMLVLGFLAGCVPELPAHLWSAADALRYLLLGALALAALGLLMLMLAGLMALLCLREPRWPLGGPMLLGLLALGGVFVLVTLAAESLMEAAEQGAWQALGFLDGMGLAALSLLLMAAFIVGLVTLVSWAVPVLRARIEIWHRTPDREPYRPPAAGPALTACEARLHRMPSHMISLTDVRGRRWGPKWLMLWLWLHIVGSAGRVLYVRGWLGTAWGIKFGHWHLVQRGRRLLFLSNFDGDFGGYLDEFIEGTDQGINLVWRWTELRPRLPVVPGTPHVRVKRRFPRTVGLGLAGCRREQAFKAYARESMLPHLYLFQAYAYSNQDIRRFARLRDALAGPRTVSNDDAVLRCLDA